MIEKEIKDAVRLRCKFCNQIFTPERSWQKFCRPSHQKAYWKQVQNDKLETNRRLEEIEKRLGIDK